MPGESTPANGTCIQPDEIIDPALFRFVKMLVLAPEADHNGSR